MEMLTGPIGENNEAHEETNPTAYGYHEKPVLGYFQHVMNAITRHRNQVEGQDKYHHSIVIVLLYVWEKSHVCRCRAFIQIQTIAISRERN